MNDEEAKRAIAELLEAKLLAALPGSVLVNDYIARRVVRWQDCTVAQVDREWLRTPYSRCSDKLVITVMRGTDMRAQTYRVLPGGDVPPKALARIHELVEEQRRAGAAEKARAQQQHEREQQRERVRALDKRLDLAPRLGAARACVTLECDLDEVARLLAALQAFDYWKPS